MSETKPTMPRPPAVKCQKQGCEREQMFILRIKKKGWQGGTGAGILMDLKLCKECALACKPVDVVHPQSFPIIQKALSISGMKVASIDDLEIFPVGIDSADAKTFRRIQQKSK